MSVIGLLSSLLRLVQLLLELLNKMVAFITLLMELTLNPFGGSRRAKMESMDLLARRLNTSITMKLFINNGNYSSNIVIFSFQLHLKNQLMLKTLINLIAN